MRDDDRGHEVFRIRLVGRQADPVPPPRPPPCTTPTRVTGSTGSHAKRVTPTRDDCVSKSPPPPLAKPGPSLRRPDACRRITCLKLHPRVLPGVKADS